MDGPVLGRFLEISISAPDVLESLAFYERLGFRQAPVGEAWTHPYAVLTDGRAVIGLHRYDFASPSLTYVQPDLLRNLDRIEALGIALAFRRLGSDVFNEAGFTDPNGQVITLLEARTFSPAPHEGQSHSRLGWFEEFALPVGDLELSRGFWERLGFVVAEESNEPWPRLGLTSDSLNVALLGTTQLHRPALIFTDDDAATRIRDLREAGVSFSPDLPRALDPRTNALLVAPEGTLLLLTSDKGV
jgi:catechol 2,3-dioxygenase-like lactoylglutathione lyase family enzyme